MINYEDMCLIPMEIADSFIIKGIQIYIRQPIMKIVDASCPMLLKLISRSTLAASSPCVCNLRFFIFFLCICSV